MRVKDCMCCGEVVQATPETNLCEIAKLMDTNHVGCIPVCQDEKIVGFVTDRDLVTRAVASYKMNTNIIKTTPDTEIGDAIEVMEKNQIRRLPVIENNKIVGMLTISDLASYLDEDEVGHTVECICDGDNYHCS